MEIELRKKMMVKQRMLDRQNGGPEGFREGGDGDCEMTEKEKEGQRVETGDSESEIEDQGVSLEDTYVYDNPDNFARKLGFSTQYIKQMNKEVDGSEDLDKQAEGGGLTNKLLEKTNCHKKMEKQTDKRGKGRNKNKVTEEVVYEGRRRSARTNTKTHTMEKAVNLARRKKIWRQPHV
jgi:hypothetical protein